MQEDIQRAAHALKNAKLIAVSTGAGISKESGLATFRDPQEGLWAKYDPTELASPQAFMRNPSLVWSWYMFRYQMAAAVQPNPGHEAVAELEHLLPKVVLITQNVDGLHEEAGSQDIIEVHGSIRRFKCFDNCQGYPTYVTVTDAQLASDNPPECPHCALGLVRPDVVWFGETLPAAALQRAFSVAEACDVMLVIGTSGLVQPAASFPLLAKRNGAFVIEVNPNHTHNTRLADVALRGPSGEVLPTLLAAVRE